MPRHNRFPANFAFRLEANDANRLRAVAEAHGYRPGEWARKIVSEAVGVDFERRSVRHRVLHADLLRGYLQELAAQGNNLNQLARVLNASRRQAPCAVGQQLDAIRRQNETIMVAILDALGADDAP